MNRTRIVLILLALLLAVPVNSHALRYLLTPSITLQETYDDNVYYEDNDDFEHYIGPVLRFEILSEKSSLNLEAGWHIYEYGSSDEFDRINHSYLVNGSYGMSENLTLNLGGGFRKDRTFDVELENLARLTIPEDRYVYTITPGFSYLVTPRNELSMAYLFETTDYDRDRNDDNTLHQLTVGWAHLLTERTSLLLTGVGSRHVYESRPGDRIHEEASLFTGIRYQLTETMTARLNAGIGQARLENEATDETDHVTRFLANAELLRKLERWTLSGSYQRDITPDLDGTSVTRDRLRASVGYAITERFTGALVGYYVHAESNDFAGRERDSNLYRISPRLGYQVGENSRLELGYMYSHFENRVTDDSDDRNRVYLSFSYAYPIEY
jgi:predicted porin